MLGLLLTGAYPTARVRESLRATGLARCRKIARLVDRQEAIPDRIVHPIWRAEAVHQVGRRLSRVSWCRGLSTVLDLVSLRLYGRFAAKPIQAVSNARIYHYRAGFGGPSVTCAKERGMVALCDHSIAHPAVLEHLVENAGRFPPPGTAGPMPDFWRLVLGDIEQADAVLVNSAFVKETFLHQGWPPERVHVIYLGVDDRFLAAIPPRPPIAAAGPAGPLRLLFAGSLEQRKGADELLGALGALGDALPWSLEIAGAVEPRVACRHAQLLGDARVRHLGTLSRADLAARMAAAEVFVFCSRAEGSARVIFEALACGCYVITTPNSGSVVEDGVHGALVPPGDPAAVETALRNAFGDRRRVAEVGRCNAALVRERYRQEHYGDALERLYRRLLAGEAAA